MKLFKYDSYKVVISEEAMAIKAFRDIWEADKTADKTMAVQELGYVYFMCDPRSDYMVISDEAERSAAIREQEGLPDKWKPGKRVEAAMDLYRSFKPPSAILLEDIRASVDKLRATLRDMDLTATDQSGKPLIKANDYVAALERLMKLYPALKEAERAMSSDMAEAGRMRGGGEKTVFEDGFDG